MPDCKECGEFFHYCSGCSPEFDHDAGYCSSKCRKGSTIYKTHVITTKAFYRGLDKKQRRAFKRIIDDIEVLYDWGELEKWIEEIDNGSM